MDDRLMTLLASGVCIGVAATLTMDVLGSASRKASLTAGVQGHWVGRWHLGIAQGQFLHTNIEHSPVQHGEKRIAMIGHYLIGIVLAVVYLILTGLADLSPVSPLVALAFGFATCVFPWFMMYPAMGFGILGLKGAKNLKLVTTSIINHLFYGFGIWWAVEAVHQYLK